MKIILCLIEIQVEPQSYQKFGYNRSFVYGTCFISNRKNVNITLYCQEYLSKSEINKLFDEFSFFSAVRFFLQSFNYFSSIPDIPKRVIATVSTDAKLRHRILRLTPANRRPLDFTYRIRDAIRYPFRVNRRGMLTVSDALTAKKYEFIVKITDRRSKQSVKITVVIRCQDPSVSVFSSYTVESSFPEVYTHPGFSSITTIYPRWQVSENLTLTPTPSSTVPISDFQNPPSRDPSSITTIHTQTGKDVATKVESSGVFFSSVPDFWTVFSVAEQVSTVQTIYSTLDSHYLAFSSMHKMQTDLMHTFNQTN